MSSIDKYARRQVLIDNVEFSLRDLYKQRHGVLNELVKIDRQLEKHVELLERLRNEED